MIAKAIASGEGAEGFCRFAYNTIFVHFLCSPKENEPNASVRFGPEKGNRSGIEISEEEPLGDLRSFEIRYR